MGRNIGEEFKASICVAPLNLSIFIATISQLKILLQNFTDKLLKQIVLIITDFKTNISYVLHVFILYLYVGCPFSKFSHSSVSHIHVFLSAQLKTLLQYEALSDHPNLQQYFLLLC